MSITIHEGWYINNAGTGNTWTTSLLEKNTSNLPENKQNKHCSGVPDVMWKANWDWSSGSSSTAQALTRAICSRANNIYDYSFCWSGLGYESYISRLQYVCYGNVITGKDDKPTIYQDNNTNTPWSFDYDYGWNRNNQNTLGRTWRYESWQNNKSQYGYNYTWKNNNNTTNPNNNNQYWDNYYFCDRGPIQAIAPNNWINLICVIAKKSLNVTAGSYSSNVGAWDLYTYAKTNIHEAYPYIIGVFIVPFAENNDSANKREMFFTADTNRYVRLSLSTYNEPAINGKLLYTSSNDTQNIAFSSMWHNSVISRPNFQGSFDNWTEYFVGNFRFKGNDNVVHSTYCAVPIMGAIFTGAQSTDLMQNGIFAYKNEQFLQLRLGDEKWLEEYGHYTTAYGYEYDGVCYYREYDSDFYDECMRQTACFGLLFTDRYSVAYEGDVDDRYMFLGVLDEHNIGHGEYTNGYDNLDQPQLNWTNTTDTDYTPSYQPDIPDTDTNNYDNNSSFNSPSIPKGLFKYYVLNTAGVENFKNELWKAFDLKPQDIDYTEFAKDQFLTNEPLDLIVSLKKYPMLLSQASAPEAVTIGKYVTNVQANELVSSFTFIDLGTVTINTHFGGNFLDYDYTQLALYVPFCGVVSLDTSIYMGKQCRVYMSIDYTSGSCTAYIMCGTDLGWLVTNTLNGQIAVDLPLSGIQAKTLEQNLASAKSAVTKSGVVGAGKTLAGIGMTVAGAVTGGIPLVLGGLGSITSGINDVNKSVKQEYELHNTQIPIDQIGSLTALNAWTGELKPRLIIYRPITSMYVDTPNLATPIESRMQAYGHSEGFAVVEVGTINSLGISGYAEFTNIDLSGIVATEEIKRDIISQLVNGVYV